MAHKPYSIIADRRRYPGVTGAERYGELDAARGVAILMMVLFHTLFDLSFFRILPVNVTSGFWRYFAFATASLFLVIAGISLTLSYARYRKTSPSATLFRTWTYYAKRGAFIFCCGLLVTLATYLYLGGGFVVFGILHVIGVTIIISPFFFRFKEKNILIGALIIAAGIAISAVPLYGPAFLLPFGIHPASFYSVDYEPVFPWSGLMIAGIGAGCLIYPDGKRPFPVPQYRTPALTPLAFLGRHSLIIYLVHQPLILLVLQALTATPIFW